MYTPLHYETVEYLTIQSNLQSMGTAKPMLFIFGGFFIKERVLIIRRFHCIPPTDADKQAAINVFLGVFHPDPTQPNIWELQTDYYIHHSSTRLSVPSQKMPRYCSISGI